MRAKEPEFDQWTDQNHMPYVPGMGRESQKLSSPPALPKRLNLLWHGILRFLGLSEERGSASRRQMPTTLL